ncbi:MAG: hypothetical protein NTW54_07220 [Bacteroidetes bacterium]|nr:hypothetical protein [Bacteroidota bacterium]
MGHIKEPEGVDFIVESRPLTKAEEVAISEYIRNYKAKNAHKQVPAKRKVKSTSRKKVIA